MKEREIKKGRHFRNFLLRISSFDIVNQIRKKLLCSRKTEKAGNPGQRISAKTTSVNHHAQTPRLHSLRTCSEQKTPALISCVGFTLMELLVVIVIIGVLTSLALPQYRVSVIKAKAVALLPRLDDIVNAQEIYYLAHGEYAKNLANLDGMHGVALTGNSTRPYSSHYWYEMSDGFWVSVFLGSEVHIATDKIELIKAPKHLDNGGEFRCCALWEDNAAKQVCKSMGVSAFTVDTVCNGNTFHCRCGIASI